jgi:NO-binding membrane sensor protein with MHYT domain
MTGRLADTKALLLVGLIFTGSLVLALVVPGVALWAVSQLGRGKQESFYLGMMGCPLAVIAWAGVLGRLNVAYKQTTGRRDDNVLATSLTVAVMVAFAVLLALIVFFGGHDPGSSGPWPG